MKKNLTVLICEDKEADALLLVRELEKADYDVHHNLVDTASDMQDAIHNNKYDIIISDFNIPGFGALEALTILKASEKDIPFVLVSGTIGEETAVKIMKAGANDYLMKSNLSRLGLVVKRELEEAKNRETHRKSAELIRANEEKYRAVINNSLFAILLVRPGACIDETNESASNLFGYSQEEFRQLKIDKLLLHEDNEIMNKISRGKSWDNNPEFLGLKKTGQTFPCEVSSISFKDIHGMEMNCLMLSDISQRKTAENALKQRNHELKRLSTHLKNVREDERKYISREIHDQLGQLASAIKMELDWLNLNIDRKDEMARIRISRALTTVSIMIETTRKIASSLRPSVIDELGLNAALKWQCSEFEKLNEITCDFKAEMDDSLLTPEISTELFRICQESLTNIMRHANATHVIVGIKETHESHILYIKDDGRGFDMMQKSDHLGLVGLRERAHSIDGFLLIESAPGEGTTISVVLPKISNEPI